MSTTLSLMANRFLKFLVGSAAGVILLAALIAVGIFGVGVWRDMAYKAAQRKCDHVLGGSYVRKADREAGRISFGSGGSTLYGGDGYAACMDDEGF